MWRQHVLSYCPVCDKELGMRDRKELTSYTCDVCDVTFYWHPNDDKPTNDLTHPKLKKKCGCWCGR